MDFSSLMQAASNNKVIAQKTKAPVLVTKLSAPKKEERKVDVEAIKRRVNQEKQRQEGKKKADLNTNTNNKVKSSERASTSKTNSAKISSTKLKTANRVPTEEKAKYENKQHEAKHKQFMTSINKMGTKAEKKPQGKTLPSNTESNKKPAAKPKTLVQAPTFKDLMALAEKGIKDPTALTQTQTKPASPRPNCINNKETKRDSDTTVTKDTKKSHTKSVTKSNPEKRNSLPAKHADQLTVKKESKNPTVGKPAITKATKSSSSLKSDIKAKPTSVNNNKRELPSNTAAKGEPPTKKLLSESAMAKLAYKEGRRPLPPTKSSLHKTADQMKQSSKVSRSVNENQPSAKKSSPAPSTNEQRPNVSKNQVFDSNSGVSAWDRLMGSSAKPKDKLKKPKRYIDSDEDDEDLDDFIDDGEDDIDYSAAIRDIFGYDKSRYRDEDFDDRTMIAGYADIMKEEVRSARIGREEDLRDIMMEEQEKKRKMAAKKKKKSAG